MNMIDIAQVLVKAKRYVPESARTKLCYMFVSLIGDCLKKSGNEGAFDNWRQNGATSFLHHCEVGEAPPAVVAADLRIQESLLSEFCNKWMNVTQFRQVDGDWTPISSDMNSLRVTMVKELEEIVNGSQEDDTSGNSVV